MDLAEENLPSAERRLTPPWLMGLWGGGVLFWVEQLLVVLFEGFCLNQGLFSGDII